VAADSKIWFLKLSLTKTWLQPPMARCCLLHSWSCVCWPDCYCLYLVGAFLWILWGSDQAGLGVLGPLGLAPCCTFAAQHATRLVFGCVLLAGHNTQWARWKSPIGWCPPKIRRGANNRLVFSARPIGGALCLGCGQPAGGVARPLCLRFGAKLGS